MAADRLVFIKSGKNRVGGGRKPCPLCCRRGSRKTGQIEGGAENEFVISCV